MHRQLRTPSYQFLPPVTTSFPLLLGGKPQSVRYSPRQCMHLICQPEKQQRAARIRQPDRHRSELLPVVRGPGQDLLDRLQVQRHARPVDLRRRHPVVDHGHRHVVRLQRRLVRAQRGVGPFPHGAWGGDRQATPTKGVVWVLYGGCFGFGCTGSPIIVGHLPRHRSTCVHLSQHSTAVGCEVGFHVTILRIEWHQNYQRCII